MSRTKFTCGCCGRELGLGEMVSTDGVLWRCKECSIKHNEEYCNKDAKIANLETKLAESESELVLARNTSINTNKMEILHLQIENEELKQQLALTEKALELACEEITGTCEYCPYATMPECPIEADCVKEKIKYFKQQAEKENKN